MKYYIIAGEASGDLHASNLIRELKKLDPEAEIRGWGGDLMINEGTEVVKHYKDLAFMGFLEVILNLRTILRNMAFAKKDIVRFDPDLILMVDFPGFNLELVEWIKKRSYKIVYYISPQVWAWKSKRIKTIKEFVDRMMVILPFEEEFFKKHEYPVDFVGHPLVDAISSEKIEKEDDLIAIIPGSRKQEIRYMLPTMLEVAKRFPQYRYEITVAPSLSLSRYKKIIDRVNASDIRLSLKENQTHSVMARAKAALVTSGTATLETALYNTPQVVCYKGNWVSFAIAKRAVKVKFISLVNLILDKPLIKELIQDDFNLESVSKELTAILDEARRKEIHNGYAELIEILGSGGASKKAATIVFEEVNTNSR